MGYHILVEYLVTWLPTQKPSRPWMSMGTLIEEEGDSRTRALRVVLPWPFPSLLRERGMGPSCLPSACPGISSGTEPQSGKTFTAVERPRHRPVISPSLPWIYTAAVATWPVSVQ